MTGDHHRAAEDPRLVARMSELLVREWDPTGVICDGAAGGPDYYQEQALTIVAMLAADARETEIQRYLRQMEQAALGESLHSFEARRAIAVTAWSLIR